MRADLLDQLPPQDLEAEKGVLGSILLNPRVLEEVATVLEPTDFYLDAHACLYDYLLRMDAGGERIDAVLLVDRLRRAGELERVGGPIYLAEVVQSVAVAAHAMYYAKIVVRCSRKRQVIHAATQLLRDAYDPDTDPDALLAAAEGTLGAIASGQYDRDPVSLEAALVDAMCEIEEIVAKRHIPGIHTGLRSFDEQVGGVFCGELTILGARTSQGKTSLALQMAANMANGGWVTYFASLEMGRTELAHKRLSSLSGISFHRIRTGRISQDEQQKIATVATSDNARALHLHDWPEIRPWDIQRAARRVGAQVTFVDYLQIVTPPPGDERGRKRYEAVGQIAKSLKAMARQLQVPVVACAQLGREADREKEGRPRLRHLRESGDIEQDADMVLLLWRPEGGIEGAKGTPYAGDRWDAELAVAKNRKGALPTIRLDWDAERTLFLDHQDHQVEEF